jgi:death on curing protein
MESIAYLDVDDVLEIFEQLIGPAAANLCSQPLLESAVLAPQQSLFGRDAYPTVGQKAWAYLRGLTQNHPFVDGNKRIAWATTRVRKG